MFLCTHRILHARSMTAIVLVFVILTSLFVANSAHAAAPSGVGSLRALELQGHLTSQGDAHYLGLEPVTGATTIVITLVYHTSDDAFVRDGVNFSVLAQDGMQDYLQGRPIGESAVLEGDVLRADTDGTIIQAALTVDSYEGYTVLVRNTWHDPVRYMLSVHGGVLVDEGGQTLVRVPAAPETSTTLSEAVPAVRYVEPAFQSAQTIPVGVREASPPAVSSDSGVGSGSLLPAGGYQVFLLEPSPIGGDATVRMSYRVDGGFVPSDAINFWVLTHDGLRHVSQGAHVSELNLAFGRTDGALGPGRLTTTVRLGTTDTYALFVFNESAVPAQFALEVEGANLLPYSDNGSSDSILANSSGSLQKGSAESAGPEREAMAIGRP